MAQLQSDTVRHFGPATKSLNFTFFSNFILGIKKTIFF